MIEIKDLLVSFQKIFLEEEIKKESIKKVLFNNIGILIDSQDILFKKNDVYLNIKPIYKNEIFIKKEKILSELKVIFGGLTPKDLK